MKFKTAFFEIERMVGVDKDIKIYCLLHFLDYPI